MGDNKYHTILRSDFIADIVASEIQAAYLMAKEAHDQKMLESCETLLKYFMVYDEFIEFMDSIGDQR